MPVGKRAWPGSRLWGVSSQKSRSAATWPARSASVATIGSRPMAPSWAACSSVREVPRGATPTYRPPEASVTATASIGPSTMTGVAPLAMRSSMAPKSWAPLWNSGVSGVLRYFGPPLSAVGAEFGVAAADEAEDLGPPVAGDGDGEGDAVAEPVDEPSGRGDGGDTGGDHLLVGDAVAAQVGDEVGPPGGCLAGPVVRVAGEVGPEPVGEVVASPRVGEPGLEEGLGELVDVEHPVTGDRAVAPLVGALEHAAYVGVGVVEPHRCRLGRVLRWPGRARPVRPARRPR